MHDLFVEPSRAGADMVVDGTVAFTADLVARILTRVSKGTM